MKRLAIFILLTGIFLSTSGFSCTGGQTGDDESLFKPITLNYWRVFDDSDSMSETIDAYQKIHPNVTINYRKFRYEEYEQELLQGFAEDRGPDMLSLHATWVDRYIPKIAPMPPRLRVGEFEMKGALNKKSVSKTIEMAGITPVDIRKSFVETVSADSIRTIDQQEYVFGVPLALDTLALFYNRDIFDNARLTEPPRTWNDFQQAVSKMTKRNAENDAELDFSAAAIGTADNMQRPFDVLSSIMMQSGAKMTEGNRVTFDQIPPAFRQTGGHPGIDALRFYTDFAYPGKEGIYTWNEDMPDAFEAFKQGRTAMFFGYSYHSALLKSSAPQLRFGVVPIPQLDPARPVTAANYWLEAVSKKSPNSAYAWDFIRFASSPEQVKPYLSKTGKPPALRSLIAQEQQDETRAAFASQALFARNWYHGRNSGTAEAAFTDMITQALRMKGGRADEQRNRLSPLISKARERVQADY